MADKSSKSKPVEEARLSNDTAHSTYKANPSDSDVTPAPGPSVTQERGVPKKDS